MVRKSEYFSVRKEHSEKIPEKLQHETEFSLLVRLIKIG